MHSFVSFARKYWFRYILCLIVLFGGVIADSFIPRMVQRIIDDVIIAGRLEIALKLLFFFFSLFVMRGFFKYLQEFISDTISQGVTHDIRSAIFDHSQKQGGSFFKKNSPSEVMSRVRHDSENVGFSFGFCLLFLIEIVVHCVVMFFSILSLKPVLAITVVVFMPIIAILTIMEERKGDKISEDISDETATMNKTASEALTGVRTVKAFGWEEFEKTRFGKRNRNFFRLSVSLEDLYAGFDSATWSLSRIMQACSILFGGYLVIKESLTLGELASYVEYVNSLVWPMLEIGWLIASFSSSNASGKKINALLKEHDEVSIMPPLLSPDMENGKAVEFKAVSLRIGENQILDDVNFRVSEGHTLGIMGETGSGKSIIVKLLTRFMDPTSGEISIGGVDISHLPLEAVRGDVAAVTQDVFLFSETIRENLKKGRQSELSDEEMIHYSGLSDAHEFIERLEEGYDTVIGERGVGLSGGQKQRLCIARALLKKAPILVLDDSTSALDMETEKEIQHSLRKLNEDGIKIIIAHRISAVRHADEIIYLEKGRIRERGCHEELMKLKGLYYETYVAQYSKEEAENEC